MMQMKGFLVEPNSLLLIPLVLKDDAEMGWSSQYKHDTKTGEAWISDRIANFLPSYLWVVL